MTRQIFLPIRHFETISQYLSVPAVILLGLMTQPIRAEEPLTRARFLMGTACTLTADVTPEKSERAFEEIARVEAFLSTWRDDSELSRLNRSSRAGFPVSGELFDLLRSAVEWSARTGGAFTPLARPLIDLWDVRGAGRLAAETEIENVLGLTRPSALSLEPTEKRVTLVPGAAIEEGAFGKGYAIDRAVSLLEDAGAREMMIDFGGQIAVHSRHPVRIAIADPSDRGRGVVSITVRHASVSTTSGSEKFFDTPVGRLSHIVDPRSGHALPPRGSATVVHESAFVADILSTALYVMGPKDGLRWADDNAVAAIFIVPDGEGWSVLTSTSANNPGLDLRTIAADFHLKGTPE